MLLLSQSSNITIVILWLRVQFSVQRYFPFYIFISAEVFFCADIYTYTFECHLPEGLPTSLEGDFGFIRYSATVVLDYPAGPPKTFVQYISVLKKLDLNLDPFMRVSFIYSLTSHRQNGFVDICSNLIETVQNALLIILFCFPLRWITTVLFSICWLLFSRLKWLILKLFL